MFNLKKRFDKAISPYTHLLHSEHHKEKPVFESLPTANTKENTGAIRLKGITKSFGKNLILNSIDLEIKPNKIFGIIGINGSGKTTLLKTIIGFYTPNKGIVTFKGENISKNPKHIKKIFGFATQDNCFYNKLNVIENIKYFGELYGLTDEFIDAHMENILRLVELYDARCSLAENLSTGMQRRLDIACALIHDPSILILDEPTEDLDPRLRREMLELIRRINKNGTTIILTSHLLSEVELVCDEIAILSNGKIIQVGTPDELRNAYTKDEEIHLESSPGKYENIIKRIREKKCVKRGKKLVIYTQNAEKILHKILHELEKRKEKLISVDVKKPSLTEIFEALTNVKKP